MDKEMHRAREKERSNKKARIEGEMEVGRQTTTASAAPNYGKGIG